MDCNRCVNILIHRVMISLHSSRERTIVFTHHMQVYTAICQTLRTEASEKFGTFDIYKLINRTVFFSESPDNLGIRLAGLTWVCTV